MRKVLLISGLMLATASLQPAHAEDAAVPAAHTEHAGHEATQNTPEAAWLKPAEAKYVCMMNNAVFDKEQMAVEVEGKTYYGCCEMCKDRLLNDASARQAVDPVSGNTVDKAMAVIGEHQGMVYYFENEENFQKFASGPMPDMSGHRDGAETSTSQSHEEHH
jgi:YHS domain-containing protein